MIDSRYDFTGLLSERLVYKPEKKSPWEWEKIPGHGRNEPLDCRNYAKAAAKALAPDFDAIDKRLKAATGQSLQPEEDQQRPAETAKKPVRKKSKGGGALDRHYDDW